MERSGKKRHYDETLLTVVIILVVIGLVMLYSTSAYNGEVKFHDPFYYLKKQGFATFIGFLGMAIVSRIDYHRWARLAIPGYLAAIALSVAVMLFGDEYNGSKRWLSLGPVSFQPSEFAKVAVILFLACLVTRYAKRMDKFRTLVLMMLPVAADRGTGRGEQLKHCDHHSGDRRGAGLCGQPEVLPVYLDGNGSGQRVHGRIPCHGELPARERLAIWRNPEQYEKGYQTLQGLYAIGSGGLFGRGLGNSVQKLGFLPEAQNDMIFSLSAKNWGW